MQTHFSQWKGDTNSFYSVVGGWCILILLHKKVIQTHLTQWDGDTNSFYPVKGWYKLFTPMKEETNHLTCNESLTQTERWYKLILLSGRVTQTQFTQWRVTQSHFTPWRKKQTHLTWKGDNERVTQTKGWHTLNLFHGRVTKTHFTLIQVQKRQNFKKFLCEWYAYLQYI